MNRKYIVVEIQTSEQGVISTIPYSFDDIDSARGKYHAILSMAAASMIPMHSCVILDNEGEKIANECYVRNIVTEGE